MDKDWTNSDDPLGELTVLLDADNIGYTVIIVTTVAGSGLLRNMKECACVITSEALDLSPKKHICQVHTRHGKSTHLRQPCGVLSLSEVNGITCGYTIQS